MSSEMRMHDDEGRCLCGCTENCAVAAELRGEITRLRAVVNRMVEEDNERFASEALLARTEAGADGAVAWLVRCRRTGRVVWSDPSRSTAEGYARQIAHRMPDNTLDTEVIPLHTHPQDASGDAERTKYEELIYAVGNKYPGETRHETALRYIRQAESHVGSEACAAMQAKEAK